MSPSYSVEVQSRAASTDEWLLYFTSSDPAAAHNAFDEAKSDPTMNVNVRLIKREPTVIRLHSDRPTHEGMVV